MISTVKALMEPVPSWVTDGWYSNNPGLQAYAIARYRTPVTTAAERDAARAFELAPSTPCLSCGRFAFAEPTRCFWCMLVAGGAR